MEFSVILVTAGSEDEAARIATALVEERLAGCVNIVPSIRSIYRWEGKVCDEAEVLLVIKARHDKVPQLTERVKQLHSYTVPEVIALPITEGSADYLKWLMDVTEGI